MQEDIERRAIALSVSATKLTGRLLAKVLLAALHKIQKEHRKAQTPQGKQSVKKLMNHYGEKTAIPLDGETRLWDKVARKYEVDYAFRKVGPKKYLLFFKAGQAGNITDAFSEYTKLMMNRAKERRPSILRQLLNRGDMARSRPREHERKREAVRDDR